MTVQATFSRISQNGDGVTRDFPVSFVFFDGGDLRVFQVSTDGVTQLLALGSDYVVSGGDGETGSVTLTDAPSVGDRIVIERQIPAIQPIKYITGGAFPAETHERALDRLTLLVQQLKDELDRSLSLPATTQSQTDLTLPEPEAGKFLGFGDAGELILRELAALGVVTLPLDGSQVANLLGSSIAQALDIQTGQTVTEPLEPLAYGAIMTAPLNTNPKTTVLTGDVTINAPVGTVDKYTHAKWIISNTGGHSIARGTGWANEWIPPTISKWVLDVETDGEDVIATAREWKP